MNANLNNQTTKKTIIHKTLDTSDFDFEEDDIELIWAYCEGRCIAELYICEDDSYSDKIYVGVTLNPYFEVDFDDLESQISDFLVCEREYGMCDLDIALSPSSGDPSLWKNYKF